MNNSRLKRALAGFLSMAMLIMCMPLVGISAGALEPNMTVTLMAQGGHFGDDVSNVSKDIELTDDYKLPAGTLDEEPTRDGYVFGYWSVHGAGSTPDTVNEDYIFTDANLNAGSIQINANWYNQCASISSSSTIQIYNGYALPSTDEVKYSSFSISQNTDVSPVSAEWYYITKGTAFDINTATKYTSGAADTDAYDYYLVTTLDVSNTFYRFKDAPTFTTTREAPAKAIDFTKDTVRFSWKVVPYEIITEITEVNITPNVTASDYTLSAGEFPTEFTGTIKGTTKSGKTVTIDSLLMCRWYDAASVGGYNTPSTAEDGKTYVPAFIFMLPSKHYPASSEVMDGMENITISASVSASGYGIDPNAEGLIFLTGPEITVGAGASSDPLLDTPIAYLEDVTVEPAPGDTTGTSFVFKNIPQLTEQEVAAGFEYVYSLMPTGSASPDDIAANFNEMIAEEDTKPAESPIGASQCTDLPKDLTITVDANSIIFFAKVNKTNPNYCETSDDGTKYYTFAQKVIPVTPTAAAVDTDITKQVTYLGDEVMIEPVAGDETGTKYEIKNLPEISAAEAAKGFKYVINITKNGTQEDANEKNNILTDETLCPLRVGFMANNCEDLTATDGKYIITVDSTSMIQLSKISTNYKNSNGASYIFAAKFFAVDKSAVPTVTFDAGSGTLPAGVTNPAETVNGKLAELPVPTRDNYVFEGWYDQATDKKVTTETVFTADATLIAKWVADLNCVKALSVINSSYVAFNGYTLVINPNIPNLLYNYSFSNYGNNIPAAPASTGAPVYYYVTKDAAFSLDTATIYDGTTKVDSSKYDYYFVQKISTPDELSIYSTPELKTELTSAKVESFDEKSVTISCKAAVYEVISQVNEITLDPNILASGYKFSQNTPYEFRATANVTTLAGNEMQITGYGYFLDSDGVQADTFKPDTEYTPVIILPSSETPAYVFAKAGATSTADAVVSAAATTAGIKLGQIGPMGAGMMMTAGALSYDAQAQTDAELAADKIDKALDDLKPTNDTVKSDVQNIVDKNKGDITAVITTFKLTPATEDTEGSLNVVITVTDAENNVEIVEKTYVIDKITASGEIIVDNDDNVGEADIDPKEAKNAIELTPEEQALLNSGEDLYIILNVKNADNTIPADDKALVEAVLNGKTVGMYLDITLFKKIAEQQTAITSTKTPITITFDMPADLINTDSGMTREYSIIRVHNGKAEILKCTFDPATGKASFMTDKFSSYAIAYQDSAKKPSAPSPVNPVRPGRPDRPAPSDPTTPDKPASDPTTPDKPTPSDPSTPDKPSTPDEPVEPSRPSFDEKLVVTAQTGRRTITLSWNEIENADGYVVYRLKHGKYVKVKTVSGTSVTFSGLLNNKTYKYIVKYTINGEICPDELADNASGKIYYKPAPTAKAGADSVTLKWKAVPAATEYEVYMYVDGKAVKLTKTNKRSVLISGLNSNTEYQYIVRAYVNDKWTVMREADIVTVTTQA